MTYLIILNIALIFSAAWWINDSVLDLKQMIRRMMATQGTTLNKISSIRDITLLTHDHICNPEEVTDLTNYKTFNKLLKEYGRYH